ncbi:ISL3 family transposase [Streptomyces sp. NPDC059743]|uniref:ISL3 family transposase n=1 Tax=Streptomyces sp. NPDC059743 TaxID=3346928 RepID=UPI003653EFC7
MEETTLRLEELLFPSIAEVAVLSVDVNNEVIRIGARRTSAGSTCPDCAAWSSRVHSSYLRFPADVPTAGRRVVLSLLVRRFFCPSASCGRRTFVEQVPGLTRRHSRWSERLRSTLAAVGLALAGRAGARMARVAGVSVSRSTVLRLVDALPEPQPPALRVVGVDEYATRKGRVYGTVLVDAESRRPVDLLPDREASTLAGWLAQRSGIEVVCRDRAPFFAEGATAGAPQAVQVADRWHLRNNLGEAAERAVARHRQCLGVLLPESVDKEEADEPVLSEETPASPWKSDLFANRIRARHATVHAMLEAGHSRRSIGRQLHMTHRTVKSLADAARPENFFTGQYQFNRATAVDEYKPYLDKRWDEGCTNAGSAVSPIGLAFAMLHDVNARSRN